MKSDADLTKKTVKMLMSELQSECLVKIYLNDQTEPYLVQQRVLQSASKLLGTNLHKNQGLVIQCDKHSAKCWRIMLYWMIQHELPDDVSTEETSFWFDQNHLVMCWLLADKYEVRGFQDEVMITLIESCNPVRRGSLSIETILHAFRETQPGSKLRELLVENVVQQQKEQHNKEHLLQESYIDPYHGTPFYNFYEKKKATWERERRANRDPMWSHRFANEDPDFWKTYLFDTDKVAKLRYSGFECEDGWQTGIYI